MNKKSLVKPLSLNFAEILIHKDFQKILPTIFQYYAVLKYIDN